MTDIKLVFRNTFSTNTFVISAGTWQWYDRPLTTWSNLNSSASREIEDELVNHFTTYYKSLIPMYGRTIDIPLTKGKYFANRKGVYVARITLTKDGMKIKNAVQVNLKSKFKRDLRRIPPLDVKEIVKNTHSKNNSNSKHQNKHQSANVSSGSVIFEWLDGSSHAWKAYDLATCMQIENAVQRNDNYCKLNTGNYFSNPQNQHYRIIIDYHKIRKSNSMKVSLKQENTKTSFKRTVRRVQGSKNMNNSNSSKHKQQSKQYSGNGGGYQNTSYNSNRGGNNYSSGSNKNRNDSGYNKNNGKRDYSSNTHHKSNNNSYNSNNSTCNNNNNRSSSPIPSNVTSNYPSTFDNSGNGRGNGRGNGGNGRGNGGYDRGYGGNGGGNGGNHRGYGGNGRGNGNGGGNGGNGGGYGGYDRGNGGNDRGYGRNGRGNDGNNRSYGGNGRGYGGYGRGYGGNDNYNNLRSTPKYIHYSRKAINSNSNDKHAQWRTYYNPMLSTKFNSLASADKNCSICFCPLEEKDLIENQCPSIVVQNIKKPLILSKSKSEETNADITVNSSETPKYPEDVSMSDKCSGNANTNNSFANTKHNQKGKIESNKIDIAQELFVDNFKKENKTSSTPPPPNKKSKQLPKINKAQSHKILNMVDTELPSDVQFISDMNHVRSKVQDDTIVCLSKCRNTNHYFHSECIARWLDQSGKCSHCHTRYGMQTGNQPIGVLRYQMINDEYVTGYPTCGMIQMVFEFDDGIQDDSHPNPGIAYKGETRTAYLPHNWEGREALELTKIAFERHLIFTVGTSLTTKKDNRIIWTSIHFKTRKSGGEARHGWPDNTYFDRFKDELKVKGITPAGLSDEAVQFISSGKWN